MIDSAPSNGASPQVKKIVPNIIGNVGDQVDYEEHSQATVQA